MRLPTGAGRSSFIELCCCLGDRRTGLFGSVLDFVLVWGSEPPVFAAQRKEYQNRKKPFKLNGFMLVASDGVKRAERAKSAILSPVRVPLRHTGGPEGIPKRGFDTNWHEGARIRIEERPRM
jgi:hypothetical protein